MGIASLLEQLTRSIYVNRRPNAVNPVHWACLRYLNEAGPQSRTVSGVARFLGVTAGPASRTVAVLQKRGWVDTLSNPLDRRSSTIALTDAGRAMLPEDPLARLAHAIDMLPADDRDTVSRVVIELIDQLGSHEQQRNRSRRNG